MTSLTGRGHHALALSLPGGPWIDEVAFVDEHVAGLERPVLVGHALGGLLARGYASTHPNRLQGVVTVAAPPAADQAEPTVGFGVAGDELRIAIVCEGDDVVAYDAQQRAAREWRAQPASVPGGHEAHRRHPELVATLIINWVAPESA